MWGVVCKGDVRISAELDDANPSRLEDLYKEMKFD